MNQCVYSQFRTATGENGYNPETKVTQCGHRGARILTYNTVKKWSQFVNVETVKARPVKIWYKVTFVNNQNVERTIRVPEWVSVYTKNRGYVPLQHLNKIHVCMDNEERVNKVVSVEATPANAEDTFFHITTKFNYNYYCDGILISNK